MKTLRALPAIALCAFALTPGFAKGTFDSRRLDREVVVDGAPDEWQDVMVAPGGGQATLGVMNDDAYLYVCLRSWDRRANQQALMRGLILRLTPRSNKAGGVGIRYPIGVEGPPGDEPPAERPDRDAGMRDARAALAFVEVLEGGKEHGERLAADGSGGLQVRANLDDGMLVYELKIPLGGTDAAHAIGAAPGDTVTVAFETPDFDLEAMRERMDGHGGAGGGPGGTGDGGLGSEGMGGGPGGMGRGPGGPPGGPPFRGEALKIKARFQLATSGEAGKK